jgi:hypothetical protein
MAAGGILEALALQFGPNFARRLYEWSRGDEAKRLTDMLKKQHPAAPRLLLQPSALIELYRYANFGQLDRERMLAAIRPVEPNPDAAAALLDAIATTQWRTKKDEELVHFEFLRAMFELRSILTEEKKPLLDALEALAASSASPREPPHHLPRVPTSFCDRLSEREQIAAALRRGTPSDQASAVVISLIGESGVGKSMLALRVAHDVARDYAAGQLYVNLRAADGTALDPGDIAAALLRQLGIPDEEIPTDPRERASKLRSASAGRRLLVVLDNAFPHPLIAELIPASPDCAIFLTSHETLLGDADVELKIEGFTEEDARILIETVAGGGRAGSDDSDARELIALCRMLPVNLRAVADWLRCSPQASCADALERLRSGGYDGSRGEAFELPYALLSRDAAALFRALGTVRAHTVSREAACALSAQSPAETELLLREIRRAGLIDLVADGAVLHELIHRFAASELERRPQESSLALSRLSSWLLTGAQDAAEKIEDPGGSGG